MSQEKLSSLEELAKIEKERVISDGELLKEGAEYITTDKGRLEMDPTKEQIDLAKREMMGGRYDTLKEYIKFNKIVFVPSEKVSENIRKQLNPGDYFEASSYSIRNNYNYSDEELKRFEPILNKIIFWDKDGNIAGFDNLSFGKTSDIQKIKTIEEKSFYDKKQKGNSYFLDNFKNALLDELKENRFKSMNEWYQVSAKPTNEEIQKEVKRIGPIKDLIKQIMEEILKFKEEDKIKEDEVFDL